MEYFGYAGSILNVNLTSGEIRNGPLDLRLAEKFVGGWGINYRFIWDLLKPGIAPLSPENPIIVGAGPLVGTLFGGAKIHGTIKFTLPATEDGCHYVASAVSGSNRFGIMLKNAGYDHLIITGRAERPVYLKIIDDDIEICDASHLWRIKDIYETSDELSCRYPECGLIVIGRAGENLVHFAMAITDRRMHFGRGGLGAVMGSKNLKAIVVQGTKGIRIAHIKPFMKLTNRLYNQISENAKNRRELGSHAAWAGMISMNMNPGLWSVFDWNERYGIQKLREVEKDNKACSACWASCHTAYEVKDGEFAGLHTETGHYLWPAILGQKLELKDHREALKLLDIANRPGMCVATMSSLLDWVTRLYTEGNINRNHTDGLTLRREISTYICLAEKMIDREGALGNAMADGWFAISKHVGRDARTDYLQGTGIAKGTDCIYPARMAKLDPMRFSMGITNPRGGYSGQGISITHSPLQPLESIREDAIRRGTPPDSIAKIFQPVPYYGAFNVGRLTKHMEDFCSLENSLGTCSALSRYLVTVDDLAELYSAATGMDTNAKELITCAERVQNLYKLLNTREGFTKREDAAFPEVWLTPIITPDRREALTDYYRIRELSREDILKLLDDYYDERQWNRELGVPSIEKLKQLGLDDLSD